MSERTPLPHVDGAEDRYGDPAAAERLADAFAVRKAEKDLPIRGVHGLHPYPARLHPGWVRRLLAMTDGPVVMDPFCGSGTTLVEAQLAGRRAWGCDSNPIALRIAAQRVARRDQQFLEAFLHSARRIHEDAAHRRETPFGALAKQEKAFPRHVLAQLISLRDSIEKTPRDDVREALLMQMSPLLNKFAERRGRPAPNVNRRAVRDHFLRRCESAVEAWADFTEAVEPNLELPRIERADARTMPWRNHSVDVVITSPPYPGVYDYIDEQERRARWLGERLKGARKHEIGRRGSDGGAWVKSMEQVLTELARTVRSGGRIFFVVGDGVTDGRAMRVDQVLRKLVHTRRLPLTRVAMVSHARPWFHGPTKHLFAERPRREHLIYWERR
jgi:hypothetical protein